MPKYTMRNRHGLGDKKMANPGPGAYSPQACTHGSFGGSSKAVQQSSRSGVSGRQHGRRLVRGRRRLGPGPTTRFARAHALRRTRCGRGTRTSLRARARLDQVRTATCTRSSPEWTPRCGVQQFRLSVSAMPLGRVFGDFSPAFGRQPRGLGPRRPNPQLPRGCGGSLGISMGMPRCGCVFLLV
jgi:hypothetical protein